MSFPVGYCRGCVFHGPHDEGCPHGRRCLDIAQAAMGGINAAIVDSIIKFPAVSTDVLRATCIVVEEAGEAMQAALDYTRGDRFQDVDLDHLITEVEQCAASCIRLLNERLYKLQLYPKEAPVETKQI